MSSTAIYLRVSTEEQRERQTIATQRGYAERWIAQQGLPPARFYTDDGISGTVPLDQRPAGARMLDDARMGLIATVAVYKVDRLGRDPLQTMLAVSALAEAGVTLLSMTESIDNSTPHGRFSLIMLCGVAGFERDNIVARSIEGTERLAKEGAWLGGIVPYGYRVTGQGRHARLEISTNPHPNLGLSEADIVRMIYSHCVEHKWSCQRIADHLNALGVPTVYTRDEREVQKGKRQQKTSGIWRAGRIRNLIVNSTYRGVHIYGKRSKKQRELIERPVPAIIDDATWDLAQATLRHNARTSGRNAKRDYLLRGLIKCGQCGLSYCGSSWTTVSGQTKLYYTCNGKTQYRGIFGAQGEKCPSKPVPGELEQIIWDDIVAFVLNSEATLNELRSQHTPNADRRKLLKSEVECLRRQIDDLSCQQDRVLGLYRRGVIDDKLVDRQMRELDQERATLHSSLAELDLQLAETTNQQLVLNQADHLLALLRLRLLEAQEPLEFEVKRDLIETLVDRIEICQHEQNGESVPVAHVVYAFTPIENRTDRDSSQR